jgi:hypothetical protein
MPFTNDSDEEEYGCANWKITGHEWKALADAAMVNYGVSDVDASRRHMMNFNRKYDANQQDMQRAQLTAVTGPVYVVVNNDGTPKAIQREHTIIMVSIAGINFDYSAEDISHSLSGARRKPVSALRHKTGSRRMDQAEWRGQR